MGIESVSFYELNKYWDGKSSTGTSGSSDPITFDPPLVGAFSVALTRIGVRDGIYADYSLDPSGKTMFSPSFQLAAVMVKVKSVSFPDGASTIGDTLLTTHGTSALYGTSEQFGPIRSLQLYVLSDNLIDVSALLTVYKYDKQPMIRDEAPMNTFPFQGQ